MSSNLLLALVTCKKITREIVSLNSRAAGTLIFRLNATDVNETQ